MLRIRAEQIEHLTPKDMRSLRDRLIGHVRQEMGEELFPYPPQEAQALMDRLLKDAADLGLTWETHIAAYAELRVAGGEDALPRLGYRHNPQAPRAEIAERFETFLETLPSPIWSGLR